jgi:hypothetical protein
MEAATVRRWTASATASAAQQPVDPLRHETLLPAPHPSARASPKQCVKRDAFMKSPRDRIEAGEAILDPKQRGRAEVKLKFFAVQEFQVSF